MSKTPWWKKLLGFLVKKGQEEAIKEAEKQLRKRQGLQDPPER